MKKLVVLMAVLVAVGVYAVDNGYFRANSDGTIDVVASGVAYNKDTASVTNGAALTPTASVMVLTGIGGANDTTNTITIANATDGDTLTIIVDGSSTNLIGLADSGNLKLSGAWIGDNNDAISLIGVSTTWVQTAESDN